MKEQEFIDAMNALKLDKAAEEKIIRRCSKQTAFRRQNRRPMWIAAACVAFTFLLVAGIPYFQHNPYTGKTEITWLDALTIKAQAEGFGAVELEKGIDTRIPSGSCFGYSTEQRNGIEVTVVSGMMAPDFQINGKKIQSINYTAATGTLFCDFNSHEHDEQGNYLWSHSFAIAPVDDYDVQDWENPTKQELVAILEDLHAKGDLEAFYNTLYTAELAATEGKSGIARQEAYDAFQAKCAQAIDFNALTLSAKRHSGINGRDMLEITILNPLNLPVPPVEAKSVTVSPGDTVSWYIKGDSALGKKIFGQKAEDVDFTQIHDEIHVAVTFENGVTENCVIHLKYSPEGKLSVELTVP